MTTLGPIGTTLLFFCRREFRSPCGVIIPFGACVSPLANQERRGPSNSLHLPLKVQAHIGSTIQVLELTLPAQEWAKYFVGPYFENDTVLISRLCLCRSIHIDGCNADRIDFFDTRTGEIVTHKGREVIEDLLLENQQCLEAFLGFGLLGEIPEKLNSFRLIQRRDYSIHDPLTS